MEVFKQLIGRLHPLIVHLPIGFIILGLVFQWYSRKKEAYVIVLPSIYLWGGVSAILACITGYLQYLGEGYSFDTVKWHLWFGIATAFFAFVMYAKTKPIKALGFLGTIPMALLSVLFFVLISFTGHQGGNITHGEDYLIEPLPSSVKSVLGVPSFGEMEIAINASNWEDALLYDQVIKPILNNRCVSCHNPKKTKGELLLHTPEGLIEGGEHGSVLLEGNAEKSELYTRMVLPMDHEDHMPPEGKTQPTKEEILLLRAWIDAGHPFAGTIKAAGLPRPLFEPFFPIVEDHDHPNIEVIAASQDSIRLIKATGVHVDPISKASNFLSVTALNKPSFGDHDFETLLPIKAQIARLDLGGTQVSDSIFGKLALLPNLTILKLDHTAITGKGAVALSNLDHLKSINLTATLFSGDYLSDLTKCKNLQKIFLYQTKVSSDGVKALRNGKIEVDYGNYEIPPIPSDSIIY